MEQLLNFDAPFDTTLMDRIVTCMYQGNAQEIQAAQKILTQFQQHPNAWTKVSIILEESQNLNSKFIALQILKEVIQYRWNALPDTQRVGIKNFIIKTVIEKASNPDVMVRERVLLSKMNEVLVQVLFIFFFVAST